MNQVLGVWSKLDLTNDVSGQVDKRFQAEVLGLPNCDGVGIGTDVCKQSVIDYSFTENCDVVCDECMNDKMVFLHQEDMVKKYGHLFKINAEDFDYGGEQWEKFLDDLRGITFVDSQEDGYLVQEIE